MEQVKILVDDVCGRYGAGEIGHVAEKIVDGKYDFLVTLPGRKETVVFGKKIEAVREYFFYTEEIELLSEPEQRRKPTLAVGR